LAVVGSIAHALTPGSHGLLGAAATPTGGTSGPLTGRLISVSVGSERYFVPLLLLVALLCLIGGPLLYMYPSWRRSGTASAALATEGPTEGGDAGGDP
jgi:H+/Cl- antiporter ClcA